MKRIIGEVVMKSRFVVLVAVLLALPVAAFAAGRFSDVPGDNVFAADIEWMAANGITAGCNPPANTLYCPDDAVTRGQMAAFMRRLSGSVSASAAFSSNLSGSRVGTTARPIATVNGFTAPGGSGAIVATGVATIFEDAAANAGLVWIEVDGGGSCSGADAIGLSVWDTFALGADSATSTAVERVRSGSHRIDLCAVGVVTSAVDAYGDLSVSWVPQLNASGIRTQADDSMFDRYLDSLRQRMAG